MDETMTGRYFRKLIERNSFIIRFDNSVFIILLEITTID